ALGKRSMKCVTYIMRVSVAVCLLLVTYSALATNFGLTADEVQRPIRQNRWRLKECYKAFKPQLDAYKQTKLVVAFEISRQGEVVKAGIVKPLSASHRPVGLDTCVLNVIYSLGYPR